MSIIDQVSISWKPSHTPMQSDTHPKTPADWSKVLVKVAGRDQQAFRKLYDHFGPRLKSYALKNSAGFSSPSQFAEELVQEVMLLVWNKSHLFDSNKAAASTWIFTLARNKRVDMLRKNQNSEVSLDSEDFFPEETDDFDHVDHLHARQVGRQVREALMELPDMQRQVLQAVYIEGKTQQEVAEAFGVPLGTVKSRIRLAMEKLKLLHGEVN
ncbi:MAG: sigma-70 family RNA polymerase sigma factor [Pseudomonadales bacterium]|nr:sigma-70 family RNA polymerase sigma factor [Pseudomonadales bacterium]